MGIIFRLGRLGGLGAFGAFLLMRALTFAADDLFNLWEKYEFAMKIWSMALIVFTLAISVCMLLSLQRGPVVLGASRSETAVAIGLPWSAAAIYFAMTMPIWASPIVGALMWGGLALWCRNACGTKGAAMAGGGAFIGACAIGLLRIWLGHV